MCGIAGLIASGRTDPAIVTAMTEAIIHRGPDDSGIWVDEEAGVVLGHRRLSIVDLSPAGHQPMASANGRLVLDFNGEIYNHAELRREIEVAGGAPEGGWRGHSDTETLLEAIANWGIEDALRRSVGMFAFALWDRKGRTLSLVRDRFGEKPLYYGWAGRDFVFGSELKALRAHPAFDATISRRALAEFAALTHVPAPLSIYERMFKLEPGCILEVDPAAAANPRTDPPREGSREEGLKLTRYWSYKAVVRAGLADPIPDEAEALDGLDAALGEAVKGQAVADVPVGAFLSGGIDSSTIVALYQRHSPTPVRTFSIGFEEAGFNEAEHAKAVARYLGTLHREAYVSVAEAQDVIPSLPAIYDEPFADSSQIPTYFVSRFARGEVKVALSGDGGDELFGGYRRHFAAPRLWEKVRQVPRPLRAVAGEPMSRLPPYVWQRAAGLLGRDAQPHLGGKVQKALKVAAAARDFDDIYASFRDEWALDGSPVRGGGDARQWDLDLGEAAPDAVRVMYCDAVSYLPDDILCKVDRAAMAVSLETRVPFLDHRVAAFAARIPLDMKVAGGEGKRILRKLLHRHAPPSLFDRPKAGFAVPVGEWIKGPLRGWAEELLSPARLAQQGWFDAGMVRRRWQDHLDSRRDSTAAIWAALMFQSWLDEQREAPRLIA